jgi:hypothetical protein
VLQPGDRPELWSERSRWWEVWLALAAVRSFRKLLCYRMGLVAFQTALKNRVHALRALPDFVVYMTAQ